MNTLMESVEVWSQGLLLLSWKGTLLALVVGLVLLMLHRHLSPAWRHGLWLLVLLRFMVPDLGHFSLSLDGLTDVPAMLEPAPAAVLEVVAPVTEPAVEVLSISNAETLPEMTSVARTTVQPPVMVAAIPSWSLRQKLTLLWLCGVAVVFSVMVVLHLRLQRRIHKDASEAFSEISAVLDEACRLADVRTAPRLLVTDAVSAPSLFGFLRPVILLPRQAAAGRDAAALKLILLHELAHLKRRDLWAQILSSCVIALHWFNPMVWIAARRLRAEAEMAADAHALRCTDAQEAHRFGKMLLGFANHAAAGWMVGFASAALLGISANPKDLRRRIEGLMDIARGRRTRWVFGLGAFVVMAVIGLTRSPAEEVKKPGVSDAVKAAEAAALTTVTGIVVDESDKPVKDAEVKLSINMTTRGEQKNQVTGEDGKFRFESVPQATSMNLRATHNDYAESNLVIFQGISQDPMRRLVLPRASWVVGKITDKRDGRPIKGAQVFFGIENKFPYSSRFDWKKPFVKTDEAGAYRLPLKVRDANEIIVRAWAQGMASQSKLLKIAGREMEFDAALEPVNKISGKVVNAEGQPVKDALVWVVEDAVRLDETQQPLTLETLKSDRSKLALGKFFISLGSSQAGGEVSLPDVDPLLKDKLWVVAMHPDEGLARMRARDLKPGMIFKLELWASMGGRILREDGSPLADTAVTIHARGDVDLRPAADTFKVGHDIQFTTDKNGGYTIDRLVPGVSFSGVTANKNYFSVAPVTVSAGPQKSRGIVLGASLRQNQLGAVRSVKGRIVMPEGYSMRSGDYLTNLSIVASGGGGVPGLRTPDKDGRFMTEPLPPGKYELSFSILPIQAGMERPRDAGRWMHFEVKAGDDAAPLNLADIVLEKADFTFKPRAEASAAVSPPPVYIDGPDGKIEITTVDGDKKSVPGVKIEILDFVDHARTPMGLAKFLSQPSPLVSDGNGKVTVSFSRMPVAGRKAYGVQIFYTAQDGVRSRKTEVMDGTKPTLRIYPETLVEVTISNPIVQWSASSSTGMFVVNQPIEGGVLKTKLALGYTSHFLLQGTTAEGNVLFSKAIGAAEEGALEIKGALSLTPGVEIEGEIEGLPADDEGTGCVVAKVFVKSDGEMNQIMKGHPPSAAWTAWAPVGSDGRFHFKAMPRGMVSLTGLGKGWITRGPFSVDSPTLVNTAGLSGKASVTLNTKPCSKRTVRVLLPDGSPAAGATVKLSLPGIGMMTYGWENVYTEDAEKHARFDKETWAARQVVADDQGLVILENRPAGKAFCLVYWTDPKTQHPHWGSGSISFEEKEGDKPVEMKVTGSRN